MTSSKPPVAVKAATRRRAEATNLTIRAKDVLSHVFSLRKGQRILIVCDRDKLSIARAFTEGAETLGATVDDFLLSENRFVSGGIGEIEAVVRSGYDICLNFFDGIPEETASRVRLVKAEIASGAKICHSPAITEEMLKIKVDYAVLKETSFRISQAFQHAEKVKITSNLGTNVEIQIAGRPWQDDLIARPGDVTNIPNGEIYCAPVEDGANGILVVDGAIGDFGFVPSPLIIEINNGKIRRVKNDLVGIRWRDPQFMDQSNFLGRLKEKLLLDEMASVIGELGIGLGPYNLIGSLLQDEKAIETIHVAFGHNATFGGKNISKTHRDFLVIHPTIEVFYRRPQMPSKILMRNGNLLI